MITQKRTYQSSYFGEILTKSIANLPNQTEEVLPGIPWGDCGQLFTPAFWKFQYNLFGSGLQSDINYRLGDTILEEIIACLLGGYGIPAEVGLMAFERLKKEGLIQYRVEFEKIHDALSIPFNLSNGNKIRYRFANQKTKYIHSLLNRDDLDQIPTDNDFRLRSWLLNLDGIGLKTASWITRNWLNSNKVAILDIHIIRAGILIGFYDSSFDVSKHYLDMERRYLDFCYALEVDSSKMDAIIWEIMKKNNRLAISNLNY